MSSPALRAAQHLHRAGRHAEAKEKFLAVLAADAQQFDAWAGLAAACAKLSDHAEAVEALRRALRLQPDAAWLRVNLAASLLALGQVPEAMVENERAIASADAEARALALRNAAIIAPGDPTLNNAAVLAVRRRWAEAEAARIRPLDAAPPRRARTRIAYTGAFFGRKNWMKMYMGVINAHDRARFEVTLIVDGPPPSPEAGYRDHEDDRIWEVTGLPNADLARLIAEAGIEVLVDLNGYSHADRLPLLAFRAAPVQVAWNGMYGTTGFSALDAVVGDRWTIPPEEERFHSEPVHRVGGTYLPFDMFYATPPVAPPPSLAAGRITFGSLSAGYKITGPTVALWAAVLRACPGARLLLANRLLDRPGNRDALLARFAAEGIGAERLLLRGGAPHEEYLRLYDEVDIALDTIPYAGGTTTVEALWQGVPFVTLAGDRWASRTSRSVLMAAGFGDWVATDAEGFVALAARLAADPAALAERRAAQRRLLAASPAADPSALCRELEALYLALRAR